MIRRKRGYLQLRTEPAPAASHALEGEGYVLLPGVFSADEVSALRDDINRYQLIHRGFNRVSTDIASSGRRSTFGFIASSASPRSGPPGSPPPSAPRPR